MPCSEGSDNLALPVWIHKKIHPAVCINSWYSFGNLDFGQLYISSTILMPDCYGILWPDLCSWAELVTFCDAEPINTLLTHCLKSKVAFLKNIIFWYIIISSKIYRKWTGLSDIWCITCIFQISQWLAYNYTLISGWLVLDSFERNILSLFFLAKV